jgi:hypothetical protein
MLLFLKLSFEYGVAESTAHDIVVWVENVLVKSGKFTLPDKKELLSNNEIGVVLVDVSKSPVEQPKKTRPIL